MKIYFIRHGESEFNALSLRQHGRVDLSEQGKRQAQFVAKRFLKLPVDVILCSDYARTKQTAEVIRQMIKKKIEYTKLLREVKRPTEIEGKHIHDPEAIKIMSLIHEHELDPNWHYSDEENFFELKRRVGYFLEFLSKREEQHILVVTHGLFIRYIIGIFLFSENFTVEIANKMYHFFKLSNTGITVCDRNEMGKWHLVTWNDHAHLG